MNNRVVHFEIPSDNPEKAIAFFQTVFGWNFQKLGTEDYWLATTVDENSPGINGALMKKKDPRQPVVNTILVENIEDYIQKIESAGGKIVVAKMPVPNVGYLAYFMDPDNNIHGIWEEDTSAK